MLRTYVTVRLVSPGVKLAVPAIDDWSIFQVMGMVPPPLPEATVIWAVNTIFNDAPQLMVEKFAGFIVIDMPVTCSGVEVCVAGGEDTADSGEAETGFVGPSVGAGFEEPVGVLPQEMSVSTTRQHRHRTNRTRLDMLPSGNNEYHHYAGHVIALSKIAEQNHTIDRQHSSN